MSRIVRLSGTAAERQEVSSTIAEGLHFFASVNSTSFFSKEKKYCPDRADADVITIYGESRVFDRQPDEKRDEFSTDRYWSSDYIVVLDKPDTELYRIAQQVPTYPAEAGMAHGWFAIFTIVAGFAITSIASWIFGQGPWSLVWGVVAAIVIISTFMYEYRIRIFFAGLFGAQYVREAVRRNRGTREFYTDLVTHLAKSDEHVVSGMSRQILRWI